MVLKDGLRHMDLADPYGMATRNQPPGLLKAIIKGETIAPTGMKPPCRWRSAVVSTAWPERDVADWLYARFQR